MRIVRNPHHLLVVAVTAAVTLSAIGATELVRAKPAYHGYARQLAKAIHVPLTPYTINPSWVISGSPVIRSNIYSRAPDNSSVSGIWECTGPTQFKWHYGVDEAIYILDGSVEIEYLGNKFRLSPGDSANFAAGTTATWTVSGHVKKTYRLYEPGRLTRVMRRIYAMVDGS